ncbi:MAG: hypothetical protein ABWY25_09160 [Paenisporosarcina sp.]
MAALIWDEIGERFYEGGVNKCVFYDSEGIGTAWNGLTAVEETNTREVDPVHFDGVKFNDIVTIGDFSAVMRAFTYPEEFLPYEGIVEDQDGILITGQPFGKFSLTYQTRIANDLNGFEHGYKIHILYNLTAIPAQKSFNTLSLEVEPMEFEWTLHSIPEDVGLHRPTGHIIVDSRRIDRNLLQDLEDILYGDEDSDAYLPPLQNLANWLRKWERLIITDNGDGTWTAESMVEGIIFIVDQTTFSIISDTAIYLDAETYEISSTDKNEEDIWQR